MFGAGGGVRDACNLADLAVTEEPEARFVSELPGSRPSCTGFRAHVVRSGSPYLHPPPAYGVEVPGGPAYWPRVRSRHAFRCCGEFLFG